MHWADPKAVRRSGGGRMRSAPTRSQWATVVEEGSRAATGTNIVVHEDLSLDDAVEDRWSNSAMPAESKLKRAFQLSEQRDYSAAIELCNEVLNDEPGNAAAFRQRAFVFARMNRLAQALDDMSAAASLSPLDPNDDFFQGYWSIDLGRASEAIGFLTKVLEYETANETGHFSETARFFRAAAYIACKEGGRALDDLSFVREDFRTFLQGRLVHRTELQQAALSLRGRLVD